MPMDFTGPQQKMTAAQPGSAILAREANLFTIKLMEKSQMRLPCVA